MLHSGVAQLMLPFYERLYSSLPFSCSQLPNSPLHLRLQPRSWATLILLPVMLPPFGNPPCERHHRTLLLITKPLSRSRQLPTFLLLFWFKSRFLLLSSSSYAFAKNLFCPSLGFVSFIHTCSFWTHWSLWILLIFGWTWPFNNGVYCSCSN